MDIKSVIRTAHQALLDILSPVLIQNKKNCNDHPEAQIRRLAELILFQGQRHPIIISKRSGFIVAGHGRLAAMKILAEEHGWDKVAVDYQDFDSDAQEYAFLVSDNAIAEWAELDLAKVNNEMLDLGPEFDVDNLGIFNFTIEVPEIDDDPNDLQEDMNKKFILEVTFPNDMELADVRDDLMARGYIVKEKNK